MCLARSEGSFGHAILTFDASGNNATWEWHRADDNGFTVSDSAYFVRDIVACPNRGASTGHAPLAAHHLESSAELMSTLHGRAGCFHASMFRWAEVSNRI